MERLDGRKPDELRPVEIVTGIAPHAAGSALARFGNTRVICAASIEEVVPRWMKEQNVPGGWVTAEYSMLPYSTSPRKPRETARGKPDARALEISRLIGRSLRAVIDLQRLGPRTITLDCDVLQADGGTRTAAITGACVALELALEALAREAKLPEWPLRRRVAAVSTGIVRGQALLDLNYEEDSQAEVDLNLVMTDDGKFVEIQASGEEAVFSREGLDAMMELGQQGIARLLAIQKQALGS